MQVFWLSLPCRPSQLVLNQWLLSTEALTLVLEGRDHSGGSAPDCHGIPFAWMDPYSVVKALYHGQNAKSKQIKMRIGVCALYRVRKFNSWLVVHELPRERGRIADEGLLLLPHHGFEGAGEGRVLLKLRDSVAADDDG